MITGDHAVTAGAIGGELGIEGRAITGAEFAAMSDDEALKELPSIGVIARVAPEDKVRLVRLLQQSDNIVAMTGDGVNDAPALKSANIGIAMGITGTEVSKEAAVMILTDDNFATIVAAVQEGKRIAGNVRSFLAFLLSANVGEVVLFAAAVIAGLGAPMTVVQVLTVNLLTDGPPAIALARDPAGRHAFRRGATKELLGRGIAEVLFAVGVVVGLAALVAFLVVREARPEAAQTAAYATVALAELAFVFSCRAELLPAWRLPRNHHLELAVLVSLAFLALTIYLPVLHEPFGTVSLSLAELAVVLPLALVPGIGAELAKAAVRGRVARIS
jgi:Ca2+-transporting ATPase